MLLGQLHHHGRELVEHEDAGEPLVAQQPVGDLLMSGHRELIGPQHLGPGGGGTEPGPGLHPDSQPLHPTPVPACVL